MENFKLFTQEAKDAIAKCFAEKLFAEIIAKTKAADPKDTGTFEVIISDDTLDRQGDIVVQDALDFTNYQKNPVVLWGHDYYSLPIGIADEIEKKDSMTIVRGRFAPTPEAQKVRAYYDAKFPIGISIGYILHEVTGDGKFANAEVLEFSFVPVPANANCVPLTQARQHNLDIAFLASKGINFQETKIKTMTQKSAEVGDPCEMDDGSEGVFEDPGEGKPLVCVPDESKSQKKDDTDEETNPEKDKLDTELTEVLKALHAEHAENIKGHAMKCQKAIEEFKAEGTEDEKAAKKPEKDLEEFKAKAVEEFKAMHKSMDKEHKDHQTKCFKAIEDYQEKMAATGAQGEVEAGMHPEHTKKLKEAHETLKSISEFSEKAAGAVKEVLDGVGADKKPKKSATERSKTQKSDADSLNGAITARKILRESYTKIGESLDELNKTIKAGN